MSDHIEVDGKKYFEESYFQIGIAAAKRREEENARLRAELLQAGGTIAALRSELASVTAANERLRRKSERMAQDEPPAKCPAIAQGIPAIAPEESR